MGQPTPALGTATSPSADPPGHGPGPRRRTGTVAWCADHPWRTLAAALLVLTGAVLLLGGGLVTTTSAEQLVGDSADAVRIAEGAGFADHPVEHVVVTARSGAALDASTRDRVSADLTAAYTGLDGVAEVGRPAVSADGTALLLPVTLDAAAGHGAAVPAGQRTAEAAVVPMLGVTGRYASAHPDLAVAQVGPGSVESELAQRLDDDFRRAELFSLPVTLGILLVAFGAVVAAGIPVLLGIGAVVTALGLTAWLSRTVIAVDRNTESLVLLIGLAVGVDYALFVIRRAREERAAGASVAESVRTAGATAGRAVVISGITVVVAMSGMLVAGGLFTSLAVGAIAVVAVAVLASATVLPALLRLLGDRIDALRLPFRRLPSGRSLPPGASARSSGWERLAGRVTRRPLVWGGAAALVLTAIALPALQMRTSLFGIESFPKSFAVIDAYDRMTRAFPQQGSAVELVVRTPSSAGGAADQAVQAGWAAAAGTGVVAGGEPVVRVSPGGTVRVLDLPVPMAESDERLPGVVDRVRAQVVPAVQAHLTGVPGAEVHIGGAAASSDLSVWMTDRLPWVIGFVLVLTFTVMLLSFGSVWLAASTVGLNLLSVGAAYGVVTILFQHTWAERWSERLLDFTSVGSVAAWLPLLMFVILFGLSMDYHVFVVSRVREAWTAGAAPRDAVRLGVGRSAGVVTSAAAVMVAVFAIFATLSQLEMKQLGVGLATAILLDATLVRGILLPAVLALLGRRAHTGPRWIPVLHH